MNRAVLIIGQTPDPHIEGVVAMLSDLGVATVVFDCFQPDCSLELSVGPSGPGGFVRAGGSSWPVGEIGAVWWRWKPTMSAGWNTVSGSVGGEFVQGEWRASLQSLPAFLPHAYWLNPLAAHLEIARGKPRQLLLAREAGLAVPETRFSNDPGSVLSMFERHPRLAYKTVHSFIVPPDEIIFTNEVTRDLVDVSREEIRLAPGTFQELVGKKHELRVTVVGDRVFAVRVNSQKSPATRIDWRHNQFEDMYEAVVLDPALEARLLAFHGLAGLAFGAYDLIVPEEGPAVFLECNPGGQWLWLERALGLPISRAVADLLAYGPSPTPHAGRGTSPVCQNMG